MGSKVHQTISRALLMASTLALLGFGPQAHALELAFSNAATGAPVSGVMAFITTERRQPPQERNMVQENRRFHPHVLVIPKGSTVNFPNRDNTQHHVYSFSPAKTFELGSIANQVQRSGAAPGAGHGGK